MKIEFMRYMKYAGALVRPKDITSVGGNLQPGGGMHPPNPS
jgi:hypothetical protein